MKKFAVFIDRDGVINHDPGNFHKIEELKILPKVSQAIRLLNIHKIPAIVVSNQSVVARGWITERQVQEINIKIESILANDKAKITRFYYCPHHPEGIIEKYSIVCNCRKPATGMFEKAAHEFGLDIKRSYVVGDSFREIESAKNLGCKSIAVEGGRSEFGDSKPDHKVKDLYEAVELVVRKEIKLDLSAAKS